LHSLKPTGADKIEFSFMNGNLMVPLARQVTFRVRSDVAHLKRRRSSKLRRTIMKKLITIVAFVVAIGASPAFAMYDPGPTTGSAANNAEHAFGQYQSLASTHSAMVGAAQIKQAQEGDFYAPVQTIVQDPTVGELQRAQEGDFYPSSN
jgi:hypothetical protein